MSFKIETKFTFDEDLTLVTVVYDDVKMDIGLGQPSIDIPSGVAYGVSILFYTELERAEVSFVPTNVEIEVDFGEKTITVRGRYAHYDESCAVLKLTPLQRALPISQIRPVGMVALLEADIEHAQPGRG